MLDKIIKYIPITTGLIIFLFICGGVYLAGFWTTFGIDVLGLVSLTEIPKSFLLPFSLAIGVAFIENFIMALILHDKNLNTARFRRAYKFVNITAKKYLIFNLDFWIIAISISTLILYPFLSKFGWFWTVSCGALIITIFNKVVISSFAIRYVMAYKSLISIILLLISTPFFSFMLGKTSSLNIYNNKDIKYIKNITMTNNIQILAQKDSLSFKSLGFLGDKFIISSLDNKEIIILNQASIQQIDFVDKK